MKIVIGIVIGLGLMVWALWKIGKSVANSRR